MDIISEVLLRLIRYSLFCIVYVTLYFNVRLMDTNSWRAITSLSFWCSSKWQSIIKGKMLPMNKFFLVVLFRPDTLFLGHMRTVQTPFRRSKMRCLIRVYTICLQTFLCNIWLKWNYLPEIPKTINELIQMNRVDKSTVKIGKG